MSAPLLLAYSPRISTTVLADRRWGVDIYHCEPHRSIVAGGRFDRRDAVYSCPGGYGVASMCAATGRSSAPGWHSDWEGARGGMTRGLQPSLEGVVARLREWRATKPSYCPPAEHRLRLRAEERAQEVTRATCTARSILSGSLRARAVRELLTAGKSCSRELDPWMPRKVQREIRQILTERQQRRANRKIAEAARTGAPNRIAALIPEYQQRREQRRKESMRARLRKGTLGRAAFEELLPELLEKVSADADAAIRQAVLLVGPIGEQCARDLQQMQTDEDFSGKRGRNHKLERTTLHRVEHLADWSAALVTLRDYASFGSSRWASGDNCYGSRGGSSHRCYLVVRDSTTGESHVLRVPPKHGNADTQWFRAQGGAVARVKAAVAWTFEREPASYAPAVEA